MVRLRPLARSVTSDRVVEAAADERTQQWLGRMPVAVHDDRGRAPGSRHHRESRAIGHGGHLGGRHRADDDVLLGVVNLFDIVPETSAEIGFWAHPEARGRGRHDAGLARWSLRHGFETSALVRIQAARRARATPRLVT